MTDSLRVNAQIAIPRRELRFSFVRSSGPGGQNVNKVASKAVLRWSIRSSAAISDELREQLALRLRRRVNDRGELIVTSQRFRDQTKNRDDCLEKLRILLSAAATRPRSRKPTRPTKASREARLNAKRVTAAKKRSRREPREEL